MGCECGKERDPEESPKEPVRTMSSMTLKLPGSLVEGRPRRGSGPLTEIIKVLMQPIDSYYRLGKQLAETEIGSLVEAEYLGSGKKCAIRIIRREKGSRLLLQQVRLSSEMEKLFSLDHPFILRMYEVLEDDLNFYIVSEAFAGGVLQDHYHDFSTEESAATVAYEVASALNYCINRGTSHGNLSPRTLVFTEAGGCTAAKLTGFGVFDSVLPAAIFSAKKFRSEPSEKSDVWNLGAVLHLLLFQELPTRDVLTGPTTPSPHSKSDRRGSLKLPKPKETVDFLRLLLAPLPQERLSAAQCLTHQWVAQRRKNTMQKQSALHPYLHNLRKIPRRNPLQTAVLRFFLTHIMAEEDLRVLAAPFMALDTDADGEIGEMELARGFMLILGEREALQATRRVLKAADQNSNGSVSFSEFAIAALGEKRLLSPQNLKTAFKCFDQDSSGHLSLAELKHFFYVRDHSEKERQWRAIIRQADRSGDGEIDYQEFLQLMANINPA